MKANYWKRTGTKTLFIQPRLIVVEDDVVLPDGQETKYLRYEGLLDYVTLIPERGNKIALTREYSYPHDEFLWQLPEGSIEAGETPEQAANRELAEEAALSTTDWHMLGMNYGHHRRTTEKDSILVAKDVIDVAKAVGDKEEQGTEVHWFTHEQVRKMMQTGAIVQKNALAALALYLAHSDGHAPS